MKGKEDWKDPFPTPMIVGEKVLYTYSISSTFNYLKWCKLRILLVGVFQISGLCAKENNRKGEDNIRDESFRLLGHGSPHRKQLFTERGKCNFPQRPRWKEKNSSLTLPLESFELALHAIMRPLWCIYMPRLFVDGSFWAKAFTGLDGSTPTNWDACPLVIAAFERSV